MGNVFTGKFIVLASILQKAENSVSLITSERRFVYHEVCLRQNAVPQGLNSAITVELKAPSFAG